MATQLLHNVQTFVADADLSAKQFTFVTIDASASAKLGIISASGTTLPIIGVLQNKPTAGQPAEVALVGSVAKVVLGTGGCTIGDKLSSDSSGDAVTVSSNAYVAGLALRAGVAGDIVEMLVLPFKI